MHIKQLTDNNIIVFINKSLCKINNFNDKQEISEFIKDIIIKLKVYYDIALNGFIRIKVHVNKKLGLLLEIDNIDSLNIDEININVTFIYDDTILYKTLDYFILNNINEVYFYRDYFYTNIINLKKLEKYIEYGEFIYQDIDKITNSWIKIKKDNQ